MQAPEPPRGKTMENCAAARALPLYAARPPGIGRSPLHRPQQQKLEAACRKKRTFFWLRHANKRKKARGVFRYCTALPGWLRFLPDPPA
ncbi:hypothetical protein ISP15_01070 [Dyella jejuensis]|uniref:Uncharacterized protein n=1 Tax=Dyella jejuensis TaxID=1432009 RepID=A0ABW8JF54_9GAMM